MRATFTSTRGVMPSTATPKSRHQAGSGTTPRTGTGTITSSSSSSNLTCSRVSIYSRVRPPLPQDGDTPCTRLCVVPPASSVCFLPEGGYLDTTSIPGVVSGASRTFPFTGVLGEGSTQAETYRATTALAVGEALSGSNAVVLVYGQSGAGKTYTVFGPSDHDPEAMTAQDASSLGLIPRALHDLFERIGVRRGGSGAGTHATTTSAYSVSASCCQLYNDVWVDLLADGLSVDHKVTPERATREMAGDVGAILRLLKRSSAHKALAATALNSHSSRGHTVFQAHITRRFATTTTTTATATSTLTFVDLAGSERLSRVGHAPGTTLLAETRAINSSLHALGTVLAAMATSALRAALAAARGGDEEERWGSSSSSGGGGGGGGVPPPSFIPWRDSRLTRFLQGCLSEGGNSSASSPSFSSSSSSSSSTLSLIVCLSPTDDSMLESISSCHFAAKALAVSEALTGNSGAVRHLLKMGNGTTAPPPSTTPPLPPSSSSITPSLDAHSNASTPRVEGGSGGAAFFSLASTTTGSSSSGVEFSGGGSAFTPYHGGHHHQYSGGLGALNSSNSSSSGGGGGGGGHTGGGGITPHHPFLSPNSSTRELDAVVDAQRTQIGSLQAVVESLRAQQAALEARCSAAEAAAAQARGENQDTVIKLAQVAAAAAAVGVSGNRAASTNSSPTASAAGSSASAPPTAFSSSPSSSTSQHQHQPSLSSSSSSRAQAQRERSLDRLANRASAAVLALTLPAGTAAAAAAVAVEEEELQQLSRSVGVGGGSQQQQQQQQLGWLKGGRGGVIAAAALDLSRTVKAVEDEIEKALAEGNEKALRSMIDSIAGWPSQQGQGEGEVAPAPPEHSPPHYPFSRGMDGGGEEEGGLQQGGAGSGGGGGGDLDSLDGSGGRGLMGEEQQQVKQQQVKLTAPVNALGLEDLSSAPLEMFDVSGGWMGGEGGGYSSSSSKVGGGGVSLGGSQLHHHHHQLLRITPIPSTLGDSFLQGGLSGSSGSGPNHRTGSPSHFHQPSTSSRTSPHHQMPTVTGAAFASAPAPTVPPSTVSALEAVQAALARANSVVSLLAGGKKGGVGFGGLGPFSLPSSSFASSFASTTSTSVAHLATPTSSSSSSSTFHDLSTSAILRRPPTPSSAAAGATPPSPQSASGVGSNSSSSVSSAASIRQEIIQAAERSASEAVAELDEAIDSTKSLLSNTMRRLTAPPPPAPPPPPPAPTPAPAPAPAASPESAISRVAAIIESGAVAEAREGVKEVVTALAAAATAGSGGGLKTLHHSSPPTAATAAGAGLTSPTSSALSQHARTTTLIREAHERAMAVLANVMSRTSTSGAAAASSTAAAAAAPAAASSSLLPISVPLFTTPSGGIIGPDRTFASSPLPSEPGHLMTLLPIFPSTGSTTTSTGNTSPTSYYNSLKKEKNASSAITTAAAAEALLAPPSSSSAAAAPPPPPAAAAAAPAKTATAAPPLFTFQPPQAQVQQPSQPQKEQQQAAQIPPLLPSQGLQLRALSTNTTTTATTSTTSSTHPPSVTPGMIQPNTPPPSVTPGMIQPSREPQPAPPQPRLPMKPSQISRNSSSLVAAAATTATATPATAAAVTPVGKYLPTPPSQPSSTTGAGGVGFMGQVIPGFIPVSAMPLFTSTSSRATSTAGAANGVGAMSPMLSPAPPQYRKAQPPTTNTPTPVYREVEGGSEDDGSVTVYLPDSGGFVTLTKEQLKEMGVPIDYSNPGVYVPIKGAST